MGANELEKIIKDLNDNRIYAYEVPSEYSTCKEVVQCELELGLVEYGKRGFDIIRNVFFVEIILKDEISSWYLKNNKKTIVTFSNFEEYNDYLDGDIYKNACYMFYSFDNQILASYASQEKLLKLNHWPITTIDEYLNEQLIKEMQNVHEGKRVHNKCEEWLRKFNECENVKQLNKVIEKYDKSKFSSEVSLNFFISRYVYEDTNDKQRFEVVMDYVLSDSNNHFDLLIMLCFAYEPNDIVKYFEDCVTANKDIKKLKKKFKQFISDYENRNIEIYQSWHFDKVTQYYYCHMTSYYKGTYRKLFEFKRYYESFDELAKEKDNDLSYCRFSDAFELDIDLTEYKIDRTTVLPFHLYKDLTYQVDKHYDQKENKYVVIQTWVNHFGTVVKKYEHTFDYFFEFVSFLNGDLSNADLLFCDGLINLNEDHGLDLTNARLKSDVLKKMGYDIEEISLQDDIKLSFDCVVKNEMTTDLILQDTHDVMEEKYTHDLTELDIAFDNKCQKISYVSDIHLIHRIMNAECKTKEDIVYVIQKIVQTIVKESSKILLIDGDTSSDFHLFKLFVELLESELDHEDKTVIFTLGNHELWNFQGLSMDEITLKYRKLLEQHHMYLLQNDVLYLESTLSNGYPSEAFKLIKYDELKELSDIEIEDRLTKAFIVILGGMGFSGYNEEFNACDGIYRLTIDRMSEIEETKKFEGLYNRLEPILEKKNSIILTHMPKKDWCQQEQVHKDLIYVSGHTHRNFFFDDCDTRIYADNQIGYCKKAVHVKQFLIDKEYELFENYDDGIYEITSEEYRDFMIGKNIMMQFNRKLNCLYMLKKHGYYCFISEAKSGNLTILNGGALKNLKHKDIQYYYDNMDYVIAKIKEPLEPYMEIQKRISHVIKNIGGEGSIHGAIVDIDYHNHIFVNPIDLTITCYYAENMIDKTVYRNMISLLEDQCPQLLEHYLKLIEQDENNMIEMRTSKSVKRTRKYLDTNIYKYSRMLKKMQKLNNNILTVWYDNKVKKKPRIGRKKKLDS